MEHSDYTPDAVRTLARLSRLLERGAGELSLPQFRVLAVVDDGGDRASWLADRLALAKPTITSIVDGLVERGYLTRTADLGDRRATRIQLTRRGHRGHGHRRPHAGGGEGAAGRRRPPPQEVAVAVADAADPRRLRAVRGRLRAPLLRRTGGPRRAARPAHGHLRHPPAPRLRP